MRRLASAFLAIMVASCSRPLEAPRHLSWSYTGATGPEHWGDLAPSFALCAHGTRQSPVDIPHDRIARLTTGMPIVHWDPVPLTVTNTGHSLQVDDSAPSDLALDGVHYSLVQFHIHAPAEHTIEGHSFDAELHLVHRSADGKLAVIALFFKSGGETPSLRPLLDAIPAEAGPPRAFPGKTLDMGALMPSSSSLVMYEGSLTTPPCAEGVRWIVVVPDHAPLEIPEADLARLRAAIHAPTNRPTQPANGRAFSQVVTGAVPSR
jgi:carbonic anhydrase